MTNETNLAERPEDALRRLAGQLAKLSDLHAPFRIYRECGHAHAWDHDEDRAGAIDCDDFVTCQDGYMYSVCRSCCTHEHDAQTEECAESQGHTPETPICPSRRILDEVPADA